MGCKVLSQEGRECVGYNVSERSIGLEIEIAGADLPCSLGRPLFDR
jgi:hypothetical protein